MLHKRLLSFTCVLFGLIACASSSKTSVDHKSALVGMAEKDIYQCAASPTKKLKRNGFDVATLQWRKPQSRVKRLVAGEASISCEAKLKIVDGKVKAIVLWPKGATVSRRHPACYSLFERCLKGDDGKAGRSFGSGFMQGIIEGLKEAAGNQ